MSEERTNEKKGKARASRKREGEKGKFTRPCWTGEGMGRGAP